jgi:hypothetical protein
MISASPRFDDSLSSVARELHLAPVVAAALVTAALMFVWLERRGRTAWSQVPVATMTARSTPYRYAAIVSRHLYRAPLLVRGCALGTLVFANVLTPLVLLALFKFPFDGVEIPLVPGVVLLLFNGVAAWQLLWRSPQASAAAQSSATASLITSLGMVCIGAVHFWTVELQRHEGIEHACSTSVTFVVILFALGSTVQALLTMVALQAHGASLRWAPERTPRLGSDPPARERALSPSHELSK